ncbi:MAG: SdpI family protein [[Clostridium] innocuum]
MKKQTLSIAFLILITFLFCLVILPFLPAQIPIHWNAAGVIDGWCDQAFSASVSGAAARDRPPCFQLVRQHGSAQEKRERFASTCNVFLMVLCLLIFGMCLITAISAWKPDALDVPMAITLGLGFLFAVMGNLMPKITSELLYRHQNSMALEDEDNWRRTHRMAGRLWFTAGLSMMLLCVLPKEFLTACILAIVLAIALLPYVYSYALFRSKRTKGENND